MPLLSLWISRLTGQVDISQLKYLFPGLKNNKEEKKIKGMLEKEKGSKEGEDKGGGVAFMLLVVLHFGLIL